MIHETQSIPTQARLSSSSFALVIGSWRQASVTDRNACEHTLLIGISPSGTPPFIR